MKIKLFTSFLILLIASIHVTSQDQSETSGWEKDELLFSDVGNENWKEKWFLDGERSQVINRSVGMELIAGSEAKNDTCHTVLWTKMNFEGDIIIEYDYTRTDTSKGYVNIIYFHATGSGEKGFAEDISLWNEKRRVPSMRTYFHNMKTYHISYATGAAQKDSMSQDYVRLRRYDPSLKRLKGTDIPEDIFNTGLFAKDVTYHIKIVKFKTSIEMQIQNLEEEADFASYKWDISKLPSYESGRIGLRHMYTRSALYHNFKVWSLQ